MTPEQRGARERGNLRSEIRSLRVEIHTLRNEVLYSRASTTERIREKERLADQIKRLNARGFWARVFNRPV